ncbi:Uncharacterized protein FKW44_002261, partial [Caligus rogercresseyi]
MSEWGVELVLSPPYHPQSNGLAERALRIVKNLLRKNRPCPWKNFYSDIERRQA